jgi:hypothetical protein
MRARLLIIVSVVSVLVPAVRGQQQFRLLATIMDSSGIPAPTVHPGDLDIKENGADAKVLKVEPANWPVKVQLLVDNGFGMGSENLSTLRSAVRGLLDALPDGTEVTFVSTAPQPRFVVKATTDRSMLLQGVDRLTPDTSAGRFVESLGEAAERVARDTSEYFPVIIAVASTVGDNNVTERDVERVMKRLESRSMTVHVVLLAERQPPGGASVQMEVGRNLTQFTNGRYDSINVASRLSTLLPELGTLISTSYPRVGGRFLVTVERPSGAKGDLQKITLQAKGRLRASNLVIDASRRAPAKKD